MADHLTYQAENSHRRLKPLQYFFELFYSLKYIISYVLGLVIKTGVATKGKERPVVLVPGIMGSGLAFGRLRRKLVRRGHPVYVFNNKFSFGSLHAKSNELESFLVENRIQDCYIIAHSTGGLATMGLGYRGRDRIYKLITLGTPFKGSYLSLFMFFLPVYWQTIPWSGYLKSMDINFTTFLNAQSIFAAGDQVIWPGKNARLGHFDDVSIPEFGHFNLLMGPLGIGCILELIASEDQKNPRETEASESPAAEETARPRSTRPAAKKKQGSRKKTPKKKTGSAKKKAKTTKTKKASKKKPTGKTKKTTKKKKR